MTDLTALTAAHALDRLAAWQLAMRAENKSPATIACYTDATTRYLRWCTDGDAPTDEPERPQRLDQRQCSPPERRPAPPARDSSPYAASHAG